LEKLDAALTSSRPPRRRWQAWTTLEPVLAGLSWQQVRGELRHGSPARQDELLAALVRIARHDAEAVTAVVACLVPGLRARIARYAPGLPTDDAWAIAVAGVCTAIGVGDLPRTFVANRLLDAAKRHLQRAVKTEVAWNDHTHEVPELADHSHVDEPSAALILSTAARAGVINPSDAALIHTTAITGHSLAFAASQLGISYETAKKRRQRAGPRLAAWWTPEHLESNQSPTTAGEVA
jgi:hypothetical protein